MKFVFAINLPRDASSVPFARNTVGLTMTQLGIDSDCVHDVKVAVTEACTNVLKHAQSVREEYEVELTIDRAQVSISIKDAGGGFDHASLAEGDDTHDLQLDATEESGRGIKLMRALVDDLEFTSEPEAGTIVHLTKSVVLTEDSPLTRFDRVEAPRV